jgi:hypothetical protein
MTDSSDGMGIGDFAMSLLGTGASTRSVARKSGNQVDISEVAVSQDQRNAILEGSFGIKTNPSPAPVDEAAILEERKRALKEEFMSTSARLKELVAEMASLGMTSTGQLGVGTQRRLGIKRDGSDKDDKKSK